MKLKTPKKEDLINGDIYLDKDITLAARIDFAWLVYSQKMKHAPSSIWGKIETEYRIAALKFLIYAFDIKNPVKVYEQLNALMKEREIHKAKNPEYIPGKSPKNIDFGPSNLLFPKIIKPDYQLKTQLEEAINNQELLAMNEETKKADEKIAKYLTEVERAAYRVLINDGLFKKNGINFDSSDYTSHGKKGFASYTLNANGELSLFNHEGGFGKLFHSSMNSGVPVVAAGEIKIENGALKAIAIYSGHYKPTLFNAYRVLEYFSAHDVDISRVYVLMDKSPHINIEAERERINGRNWFILPATDLCKSVQGLLNSCIRSMDKDLKKYKDGDFRSFLYRIKDMFLCSSLTDDKAGLANDFLVRLNAIKGSITNSMSTLDLENAINKIDTLINDIRISNDKLNYAGRFSQTIGEFKQQLSQVKNTLDHSKQSEVIDERYLKTKL
jgi:hypothetical protein